VPQQAQLDGRKILIRFSSETEIFLCITVLRGHAVAQLVEALRYKPEGRAFGSRWCNWIFSLT
jgi:hypothetical protein